MNVLSIFVLVLGSLSFYVGLYHLVIFFRGLKETSHISFAFTCLAIGVYDLFCSFLYSSSTAYAGFFFQIGQIESLCFVNAFLVLFTYKLIGKKLDIIYWLLLGYLGLQAVLVAVFPDSLAFDSARISIKHVYFFSQYLLTYHEFAPGIIVDIHSTIGLLSFVYILVLIIAYYRKSRDQKVLKIIFGLAVFFTGAVNDTLVSTGIYSFIYMMEYTYMVLVFVMSFYLTDNVVHYVVTKKALEASETKYRELFEAESDAIFLIRKDDRMILEVNPAAVGTYGYTHEEFLSHPFDVLVGQTDDDKSPRTGFPAAREYHRKKNGINFPVELTLASFVWKGIPAEFITVRDISERIYYEQELSQEKERLAVTLRSIGDGVITVQTNGKVLLLNKVAEDLTGWTQNEAAGRNLSEVFVIADCGTRERKPDPVTEVLKMGRVMYITERTCLIAKDGKERIIADSGAPIRNLKSEIIGVVIVFRDVTEQEKLEKELIKKQKLESLGVLAGGIAHDFNNILVGILGNINLANLYINQDDPVKELIEDAEKAASRAKDLTMQLLTFSKGGMPVKKVESIGSIIEETAQFALRGSKAKYEIFIDPELWPAKVDAGQISQVINNLVLNADQAMKSGGHIRIRVTNHIYKMDAHPILKKGKYIMIRVEDEGAGISRELLEKIFDPYFTTKDGGSGLGLTSTYSIIKNHGGSIEVESEVNKGSIFTVYLKASEGVPEPDMDYDVQGGLGQAKLLIIDDDQSVLNVIGKMCQALRIRSVTVDSGEKGIILFREALASAEPFSKVIVDLTIPGGMGGREIVCELKNLDPDIKVIVSSGFSNDPIMANYKDYGFEEVLVKPFQLKDLKNALLGTGEHP